MRDKIKRVLKKQLSASTIAQKTRLTVDCVLSHLALMVYELVDNGVVFVSPQKEWHGAKVYLLVKRNIKPKKKGKYKWWNIK